MLAVNFNTNIYMVKLREKAPHSNGRDCRRVVKIPFLSSLCLVSFFQNVKKIYLQRLNDITRWSSIMIGGQTYKYRYLIDNKKISRNLIMFFNIRTFRRFNQ